MEYCDLGSLDSAISDGRFHGLVSYPPLSIFTPLKTNSAQSSMHALSRSRSPQ